MSELPRPKDWDEFEEIVWDIFKHKWNDPNAKRYGRSGQQQQGVDVYGQPKEFGGDFVGVQCKRYDEGKLDENVVREEIKKAEGYESIKGDKTKKVKGFVPPIVNFIIATTAPRDAVLQEAIRLINQERVRQGKFSVDIMYWEDLSRDLTDPENTVLLIRHYGEWFRLFKDILESGDYVYHPIKLHAPLRNVFDPLIEDRMKLFGGRGNILTRIAEFIQNPQGGYLVVTALPGFGKTALMASLVKATPDAIAYHFFTSLYRRDKNGEDKDGVDSLSEQFFLRNVVQQMAEWHRHEEELPDSLDMLCALYHDFIKKPLGSTQVLILDGLDEVTRWKLSPYFSQELPEKLKIILTIRDVGQNWIEEYKIPPSQVLHLRLGGLMEEEVAEILQIAGVHDPALPAQIIRVAAYLEDERLGADPFYVRLLLEDLAAGDLTTENLSNKPKGLENFLKEWWKQIKQMAGDQPAKDLFGTLAVALGPIFRVDLEAINPSLTDDWAEDRFDEVLENVRRFVAGDDKQGYALAHPRLATYMHIRIRTGPYADKVLDYCDDWQQHSSRYALSHYAWHLEKVGRQEDLYKLIGIPWLFRKVCLLGSYQSFRSDLEPAMKAACQESPINWVDFIRCYLIGASFRSLSNGEVISLVAEEMTLKGERKNARKILDQALLSALNIQQKATKAKTLSAIAKALALAGIVENVKKVFDQAIAETQHILSGSEKVTVMSSISLDIAQTGDRKGARQVAYQALANAQAIEYKWTRAIALSEVALALKQVEEQGQAGEAFSQALNSAWDVPEYEERAYALCAVASAKAQAGDKYAKYVFRDAVSQFYGIGKPPEWIEEEFQSIYVDYLAQARDLNGAFNVALDIRDNRLKKRALDRIAEALAKAILYGNYPEQLGTGLDLDRLFDRSTFYQILSREENQLPAFFETLHRLSQAILDIDGKW